MRKKVKEIIAPTRRELMYRSSRWGQRRKTICLPAIIMEIMEIKTISALWTDK